MGIKIKIKLINVAAFFLIVQSCSTLADGLVDGEMYGRIITTVISVDQESVDNNVVVTDVDNWQVASNASRLGFKGNTSLNDDLSVIYQIEYAISTDDGSVDGDEFSQRNTYVGLKGTFGSVLIGKHDTPFKRAQYGDGFGVDLFDDLFNADIGSILKFGEVRHNNIILYNSPELNGLSTSIAFMPGEEAGPNASDNGLADSSSASIKWQKNHLYFAAAIDNDVQNVDAIRLVSHYKFGNGSSLGLIYQSGESADASATTGALTGNEELDGWIVNTSIPSGSWVWSAQYGSSNLKRGLGLLDDDITQLALRSNYVYSKRAKLFAYYSTVETTHVNGLSEEDSVFGVGIDYHF